MSRTLQQFYDENEEFRQLIRAWISENRCPIGLVDFLIENGYERQAYAANWAANAIELPISRAPQSVRLGPVPANGAVVQQRLEQEGGYIDPRYDPNMYYWYGTHGGSSGFCYDYPGQYDISERTQESAIIGLLDSIKLSKFRIEHDYLARNIG